MCDHTKTRSPWPCDSISFVVGSYYSTSINNQCLSPLMLLVWIPLWVRCTILCDKVCQWLASDWWFSPGIPVSSTNKTDLHNNWNIVESAVEHHKTIKLNMYKTLYNNEMAYFFDTAICLSNFSEIKSACVIFLEKVWTKTKLNNWNIKCFQGNWYIRTTVTI
jgi:hypothetical protein